MLVVVGVIAAAVVGYIVYMSYFTAEKTIGKDVGVIGAEEESQPFVMPTTEEEKLDALNNLTSGGASIAASESAKEEALNNASAPAKGGAAPAGDAEKIKLLESLKK